MKPWTVTLLLLVLMGQMGAACSPAYSPPARTGHYGAPVAPQKGRVEVGGSFYLPPESLGGGGQLGYAVSDTVQVEAGADALVDTYTMGFLGVRIAPFNRTFAQRNVAFTFDGEIGAGIGVGGEHCWDTSPESDALDGEGDCDDIPWNERLAGGGYGGLGFGFRAYWFDAFVRGRMQFTGADSAPMTIWLTGLSGVQFTILRHIKLYVASGIVRYDSVEDEDFGPFFEAGLSVLIPTAKRPAARRE